MIFPQQRLTRSHLEHNFQIVFPFFSSSSFSLLSLIDSSIFSFHLQNEPDKISGGQQSCSIWCEQRLVVHRNMVLMGHLFLILIVKLTVITFNSECPSNKHHVIESKYALDKSVLKKKIIILLL